MEFCSRTTVLSVSMASAARFRAGGVPLAVHVGAPLGVVRHDPHAQLGHRLGNAGIGPCGWMSVRRKASATRSARADPGVHEQLRRRRRVVRRHDREHVGLRAHEDAVGAVGVPQDSLHPRHPGVEAPALARLVAEHVDGVVDHGVGRRVVNEDDVVLAVDERGTVDADPSVSRSGSTPVPTRKSSHCGMAAKSGPMREPTGWVRMAAMLMVMTTNCAAACALPAAPIIPTASRATPDCCPACAMAASTQRPTPASSGAAS